MKEVHNIIMIMNTMSGLNMTLLLDADFIGFVVTYKLLTQPVPIVGMDML